MPFDAAWCQRRCAERGLSFGLAIQHRALTGSTNDDALALARSGASHGTVVVADAQTQARGRRGNMWLSAPGEGLTFSCVIKTPLAPEQLAVLPLVLGLGVREVVASFVPDTVLVKWPNDVWVAGLKVCGILAESYVQAGRLGGVVVGVGLNVAQRSFEGSLNHTATSLWLCKARSLEREKLLLDLLSAFDERVRRLVRDGFDDQWRELAGYDALLGRTVRVDQKVGVASGIARSGALCITCDAKREEVLAGSVMLDGA